MSRSALGRGRDLLKQFLDADPGREEEAALERLLEGVVPVVDATIRRKLGHSSSGQEHEDFQDIRGDALLALIDRLQELRRGTRDEDISDLFAYARAVASSAFGAFLYRRKPQWRRTAHKVRYILEGRSYASGFALWEDSRTGRRLAGYAGWRGQGESTQAKGVCSDDSPVGIWRQKFVRKALGNRDPSEFDLEELLAKILDWLGGPVTLESLAEIVVTLRGDVATSEIREAELAPQGESRASAGAIEMARSANDVASNVEAGELLRWLWREIQELPDGQRKALLLSMGGSAALAAALVASDLEALATSVGLSLAQLPEALKDSSSDRAIARQLELTVRDVINLRKTARERLVRRYQRAYAQTT